MPLGQAMETQQQVVVILLKIRPGTFHQGVDVIWLVIKWLQHSQLHRQLVLGDYLPGLLDHGGHRAVGELWIKRRQGNLAHALRSQTLQHRRQGRLTITHGDFHRPMLPMLTHGSLQTPGQHHQRRAFIPPDRGIGMGRLLRTLDQNQRHQQTTHRPRQVDDVGVHQKLIEIAAHIGHRSGGRRAQVDQQQSVIGHATSYFRGAWTNHPAPIANH
ncbi:hypothetical protein D3C80_974680 [compost metagenome]